jgi:hypothetical protein
MRPSSEGNKRAKEEWMASKPRRVHLVGDRVVASGWRRNMAWECEGTVVHTYQSAIDGPIVVLADVPESDGSPLFDVLATEVASARRASPPWRTERRGVI